MRYRNQRIPHLLIPTLLIIGMVISATAQRVTYHSGGITNAAPGDYSTSFGPNEHYPRNYNYYYSGGQYAPRVIVVETPVPMTVAQQVEAAPAPVIGYVKPYTDTQYADVVIAAMNAERKAEGEAPMGVPKPAKPQPAPEPTKAASQDMVPGPALYVVNVANVLDRGVMVTSSGLELRLRGVAIPSMASTDPVRCDFASRVISGLRELTVGKNIYFTVEKPQKGLDGRLLAIAHLRDGTELNRLVLESGMAVLAPGDFPNESAADELMLAERDARKEKRGFWAH